MPLPLLGLRRRIERATPRLYASLRQSWVEYRRHLATARILPLPSRLKFVAGTLASSLGIRTAARLRVPGARHPLVVRFGTSDPLVLHQIFVDGEYQAIADLSPATILDLGANVGYATAWFATRWPDARIIAVEPDAGNATLCEENARPYGSRVQVIRAGVWPVDAALVVERGGFADGREWAFQVREARAGERSDAIGKSIPTLSAAWHGAAIDLLKIDIERSELPLFSRETDAWLPRVRNLVVELHGADCEQACTRALEGYSARRSSYGEYTIFRDLRPVGTSSRVMA